MPNWCECELSIFGPNPQAVLDFIRSNDGASAFDFNKVVPMPAVLDGTVSPGTYGLLLVGLLPPDEVKTILDYPWVKQEGVTTVDELKALIKKRWPSAQEEGEKSLKAYQETGFTDWYQWTCAKWGTKWNASEPRIFQTPTHPMVAFQTAWSPPLPVIKELAKKFPDNRLELLYWEGGMGFKGCLTCFGNKVIRETQDHYSGPRGG